MADSIHHALAEFRDSMLTAVARLEFTLRDSMHIKHPYGIQMNRSSYYESDSSTHSSDVQDISVQIALKKMESTVQELSRRMNDLSINLPHSSIGSSASTPPNLPIDVVQELMSIHYPERTGNVLVPSVRSTPALAAAIAAANVPSFTLSEEEEEDEDDNEEDMENVKEEEDEEEDGEEEVDADEEEEGEVISEEEDEEDESASLRKVVVKGVTYYMDDDNSAYLETDDGYEQVGVYNPKTGAVEVIEEDDEEEEEEEDAVEVEEFVFKGKTYQRDAENNVYLDGDHIGTWNGKKIIATT